MPVKHDLLADLSISKDELVKHRSRDPKLNQLVDQYDKIDADVLKAEASAADDDQLRKLKEKRLTAKDKIVQQLSSSG